MPALTEQDNIELPVDQIQKTVRETGIDAELIVVDDGSTDATLPRLAALACERPWLKVLHRDVPRGQSAAMEAGIRAATAHYVATLDADLQNDPADLPAMLGYLRAGAADMVQGDRTENRRDNVIRRLGSIIGRWSRRLLLGDPVRDTGCSARIVRTELARKFPLQFKGMHRFLPIHARMLGAQIIEMPVHHRRRAAGQTKYGFGGLNRGLAGLVDCLAVRWMMGRYRNPQTEAIEGDPP